VKQSSSAKSSPFLRVIAAGMLFVWLAAVTACSINCSGECSCSDSPNITHAVAASGQSHDSDKHHDHDDSLCVSLHSLCPTAPNTIAAKPDFGLAFTLNFISTSQLVALASSATPICRQPPDANRVFTPEVCLGPAFHSLAPPSLV
jgi:hypothetical protein